MTTGNELDASVLVPLMDDRETGERCIRAWTEEQSHPGDRYEVIALAPGVDPELEAAVRPLLRPHDRWIVDETPIVVQLLNVGARQARGRFLFLTEAHCAPDPGCLAELVEHLESTGAPGARGTSVGRAVGRLGELERAVYLDAQRRTETDDHWNRVLIHSFAIRRDVFLEAGGFQAELGDFSNYALGIELWERGHRLGFKPSAVVHHTYDGELRGLAAHIRDFGRGEIAYCASTPADLRARFLEETPQWTDRRSFTKGGAREALRAALALRHPDLGVAREALRHAVVAAAGPRGAVALGHARSAFHASRALARRGSEQRLEAFHHFWRVAAATGCAERLQTHPPAEPPPEPSHEVDLTALEGPRLMGFHVVEEWQGECFRWSSPLALVEVALPPEPGLTGRLELLPLRESAALGGLRVAVDGRRVPHRVEDGRVHFPVEGGGRRWLAFAIGALRPRREGSPDHRDLGLAVRSLSFASR